MTLYRYGRCRPHMRFLTNYYWQWIVVVVQLTIISFEFFYVISLFAIVANWWLCFFAFLVQTKVIVFSIPNMSEWFSWISILKQSESAEKTSFNTLRTQTCVFSDNSFPFARRSVRQTLWWEIRVTASFYHSGNLI